MDNQIVFTVHGLAQPAGSKRAFVIPGHGARVVDANPKAKSWKQEVAHAASGAYKGPLLEGPLEVTFLFFRPRPAGHFGKSGLNKAGRDKPWPTSKPDVLKLSRAIEDACTGIIWRDDAQIVLEKLEKHWGEPARTVVVVSAAPAARADGDLVKPF